MAEKQDIEFNKNEDQNKQKLSDLNSGLKKIHLGGGEKRIAIQHEQGEMTPSQQDPIPCTR